MPAIPYTKTATTDGAWDAGANEKRLPSKKAALRASHAWMDAGGDPDTKSSYKFPHHEIGSTGTVGAANTRACSAIIAALNGGRGGAKIPDADRKGVFAHAAGHLKAAGKDVPELKSLDVLEAERRTDEVERRVHQGRVEIRTAEGGGQKLDGYAAVFNQETMIGSSQWSFREQIAPGAFSEAIEQDDVRALFNHDENYVLGRNKSGTLRLAEDDEGLRYEIDPPDTSAGRDVVSLVARGDVDGSSFAFRVIEDSWEYPKDPASGQRPLRTVLKVELFDVSPVTYPAYPQTTVSARARSMATGQPPTSGAAKPGTQAHTARDGNGVTGGGDAGDVGGDVGGTQSSKAAIQKAIRKVVAAKKAVRSMIKALDISHGFNPSGGDLTGPGGSQLGTGTGRTKHLSRKERKLLRKQMRARRDSGDGAVSLENANMYYAARSIRGAMLAAHHGMNTIRAICRASGMDLSDSGSAEGSGGDGTVGADASGGANAATLDLDLRAEELELERLR